MASNVQDMYLPLFLLQSPQRTLARFNFTQKDWFEMLVQITKQDLSLSNIGTTFVTMETFCKVISVSSNIFGRDRLLWYYVEDATPSHLGPVGMAVASAPTVGDGLDIWIGNTGILSPMLTISRHTTLVDHYIDWSLNRDMGRLNEDYMELALLLTYKLIREVSSGRAQVSISFSHTARFPAEFYMDHFGIEPKFGQPQARVSFRRADLSLVNDSHSLLAFNQAMVDVKLLARMAAEQIRLSHSVRRLLLDAATRGEILDQERVAGSLHYSVRTLARRLQEEGSSFRELQAEARIELAMQLLRRPSTLIKMASSSAGFSDTSAFSRAFRRYAHVSPKEYQERYVRQTVAK